MKIAISYSGSCRTFEHCVQNHSKLIGDADVFISTWDESQRVEKINDPWHFKLAAEIPSEVTEDYIKSCIPASFNLKKLEIESYQNCPKKKLQNYDYLNYQYWKIKRGWELINNPYDYDIIVRLRMDILIESFSASDDKLVFNEFVWYNKKYNGAIINEMIWTGPPDLVERSVRIYDNLEKINDSLSLKNFYGESICHKNLELEQLREKLSLYNFGFSVVR